ncbi:uncharacterized protein LOC134817134 isoform X2 [Bolinopsis microptera]|uniref:uncharacterized protein LOC134817134 isoform X2 n=1 Tax=Bolinopsis microptera TaxID=2820187 RepID=UPI003079E4B1
MPSTDAYRETLEKRRQSYNKQRSQMQRFKFRQPNNTPSVNFSRLNHYHLYLRKNPGIKSYSHGHVYNISQPNSTTPIHYSACDVVYPSMTGVIEISGHMIMHPSTDLKVYKRLIGNRDLAKEADFDNSKLSYIEKTALDCKSTNYKCFRGPKLQWQCMGSGVRRASLLIRDNYSTSVLAKLAAGDGQRLLAIGSR